MQHVVAEERQADGVPLAVVKEVVDRLHGGVVTRALAEGCHHAAGHVHQQLDVGEPPLGLRLAELLRAENTRAPATAIYLAHLENKLL